MATLTMGETHIIASTVRWLRTTFTYFEAQFSSDETINEANLCASFITQVASGSLDSILLSAASTIAPPPSSSSTDFQPDFFTLTNYSPLTLIESRSNSLLLSSVEDEEDEDDFELDVLNSLRNLICMAVEETCDNRSEYISKILSLPSDDQKIMMQVIESGKSTKKVKQISALTPVKPATSTSTSTSTSSTSTTTGTASTLTPPTPPPSADDNIVTSLKQRLVHQQQLTSNIQAELSEQNQSHLKAALAQDLRFHDMKLSLTNSHEAQVKSLIEQISHLKYENATIPDLNTKISTYKDENDILETANKNLEPLRAKVDSYKRALSSFNDVKAKLKSEEESHASVIDRLVNLEHENKQIPQLKKQLESYKIKTADLEVGNAELTSDIGTLKTASSKLAKLNVELSLSSNLQVDEAQKLQRQLLSNINSSESIEDSSVRASGSLEWNEEIGRLRQENSVMKLEQAKLETLSEVEDKLDDAMRTSDGFKKKWTETKSLLAEKTEKLKISEDVVLNLEGVLGLKEKEVAALAEQLVVKKAEFEKEVSGLGLRTDAILHLGRMGAGVVLSKEVERGVGLETDLRKYRSSHSASNAAVKNKIQTLRAEMTKAISKKTQLDIEVEDLGKARRKLERENNGLKEEVVRLKKNGGGGRGGGDLMVEYQLEMITREFKMLQKEHAKLSMRGIGSGADNAHKCKVTSTSIDIIRREFEDTVAKLKEERREMIFLNCSFSSDVAKAQQAAWMSEERNGSLKEQVSNLQLRLERMERTAKDGKNEEDKENANFADVDVDLKTVVAPIVGSVSKLAVGGEEEPGECNQQ